jgi:fructose-1,6-bisphosphatase/inositol monophosphatase family enzyme
MGHHQGDEMINVAIQAAREAGKFLRDSVGHVRTIETKQGEERNLVSEIDRGSEERIISMIKRHYPTHGILAEESGAYTGGADYTWIIDPLDGTTNFLHGLPVFCVTIGIEHGGEPGYPLHGGTRERRIHERPAHARVGHPRTHQQSSHDRVSV